MAITYPQQQIDKALETLPEELQEAMFSMETANHLSDIYNKNGITDNRAWQISEYVGYVLMGLVLPQELEGFLQKEIKLSKKVAQEIAREINRFVFYPVKPALEQLHNTAVGATTQKTSQKAPAEQEEELGPPEEQKRKQQERPDDPYREELE